MNKNANGSYASVNGLNMYYEIHGTGRPLILLHGGVAASEMFDPLMSILAVDRQVITVHLQAHGRTTDIDRPLRFELMADDIAALMKHLVIEKADIMGYSLGGGVTLQTAIRHPDVIRKLVLVSTPIKRNGWYPEVLENEPISCLTYLILFCYRKIHRLRLQWSAFMNWSAYLHVYKIFLLSKKFRLSKIYFAELESITGGR